MEGGGASGAAAAAFSLAYAALSACFVFPPDEFRAAGLTVPALLGGRLLGSEDAAFVQHHLRRGLATLAAHALLPLGYYVGMCFAVSEAELSSLYQASESWRVFFVLAILAPTAAGILAYYWSRNDWKNHPLVRTISLYALPQSSWREVAASINTEFRRIDKFATGAPGGRVIVTDTWVMKVTTYSLYVAQQQDISLTVVDSRQHDLLPDSNMPAQFLTIRVASVNPHVKSFDICMNSTEYGELREKLHAPIRHAANVVINKSLSDFFLETFTSLVEMNQTYAVPSSQELEPCVGCMQIIANVKLLKNCQEPHEGECQQCYCRPMWCVTCMGKWFASRQDQQHPETWLSSHVPCPTCRAKFCILDVCIIR